MGGNNTHPTAANVCDRLRMLFVSKNVEFVVESPSVKIQEDTDILSAEIFRELLEDYSASSGIYLI